MTHKLLIGFLTCIAALGAGTRAPAEESGRIAFTRIAAISNRVWLTIGYPGDFTNRLDVFATSEDDPASWSLLLTVGANAASNHSVTVDAGAVGATRYFAASDADADQDADGVADGREARLFGSDAQRGDSDGDGLPDAWEVFYGFDPASSNAPDADTDADQLSLLNEAVYGTDPAAGDSDGDGVSDGAEAAQGSDPADAGDGGSPANVSFITVSIQQGLRADRFRVEFLRDGAAWPVLWWPPTDAAAGGTGSFRVLQGRVYRLTLVAEESLESLPMDIDPAYTPGPSVKIDGGTNALNPPLSSDLPSGVVTSYQVEADVRVDLIGYDAFRGVEGNAVPDADEAAPAGVLVTPDNDNTSGYVINPREARILARGLTGFGADAGFTRWLRFTNPSKIKLLGAGYAAPTEPPAELSLSALPGVGIGSDVSFEVHMTAANWAAGDSVQIDYVVKDEAGRERGSDTVRLIGPVIMALGDSVTFGFRRDRKGVYQTPPAGGFKGWSSGRFWNQYPPASNWQTLSSPWNKPSNRLLSGFQGYRGYLASVLPGFRWAGEATDGHGPFHMGYNGASINDLRSRMPKPVLRTEPCYAIVLYCIGLNDVIAGRSRSTMYASWVTGVNAIMAERAGKGRTLIVGVQLPKMGSWYGGYSSSKQNNLTGLNSSMASFVTTTPLVRYKPAYCQNIGHTSDDDGLHLMPSRNIEMAKKILTGVLDGLK